jgi:aspartyl-tRNA(Asn)/glutamyl-tRNA(Gln) amidotransferase subunit B
LTYEVKRQADLLDAGQNLQQDTRLWDAQKGITISMRSKEGAKDYRYFPDPDLTIFIIDAPMIAQIKTQLPELPQEKMQRFMQDYALTEYEAKILVSSKKNANFSEECINSYPEKEKKSMVNWLIGPLLAEANLRKLKLHELNIDPNELISLIGFVDRNEISFLSAKNVLTQMLDSKKSAQTLITEGNLLQISNAAELDQIIQTVIIENEKSVTDFKAGKTNALMFLVGQVMKKSAGKANPKVVSDLIQRRLV